MITKIYNCRVITANEVLHDTNVYYDDGRILTLTPALLPFDKAIDAGGNYVSAGFVDIHTHGAGGADFLDGTADAFITAARAHAQHGATTIIPTMTSVDKDGVITAAQAFEKAQGADGIADMPGLHLEGPYLAFSQKGAQEARFIHTFDEKEIYEILSATDKLLRWTAAPELNGAEQFGEICKKYNILPSMGHTDASFSEAERAYKHGFTHITHLYSCMSTVHRKNAYRIAGVTEAAYLIDDITVEIIADGAHLPAELLKFVYKFKGRERTALVTDSMRAAGTNEKDSILGKLDNGLPVVIEEGVAKLTDKTAFAGSVATCDRLVRTVRDIADIPLVDAVYMMTKAPADILNLADRGELVAGKRADITVFDENIDIKQTIVNGKTVYKNTLVGKDF